MLGGCFLSLGDKSSRGKRLCLLLPIPGRAGCRAHGHQDAVRGGEEPAWGQSNAPSPRETMARGELGGSPGLVN